MNGNTWPLALFAAALGLWAQYAIIKTAVHHGLAAFLRDAARAGDMREGYDVPRRLDSLAAHIAEVIRRPPDEPTRTRPPT